MNVSALVWRQIPQGAQPCHFNWILRASGRWNRLGEYGALYTSLHPFGALLEYAKYLGKLNILPNSTAPRELVSLRVEVNPVLDVRNDEWVGGYHNWPSTVLGDSEQALEICRGIADDSIALGYRALRTPSSIIPGNHALDNLVIFPDGPARNLSLVDGPDRITIGPTGSISPKSLGDILTRYPYLALPGMDLWV